jgi:hypothetical protein
MPALSFLMVLAHLKGFSRDSGGSHAQVAKTCLPPFRLAILGV